jgi:hypothetical protein
MRTLDQPDMNRKTAAVTVLEKMATRTTSRFLDQPDINLVATAKLCFATIVIEPRVTSSRIPLLGT